MAQFLFYYFQLALIQTNTIIDTLKGLKPDHSFEVGKFFILLHHMGLFARIPVFGGSDQVIPKTVCSASETN